MPNSSDARRGSRTWWVGLLSLVVCLGAGSGGLHAQERVTAIPAVLDGAGESVARIDARDQTNACDADDAKIRYLIEELITQRFESAQLSIKLAEARAEAAEFKEVSRRQGALLAALMALLARGHRQDASLWSENRGLQHRLEVAQAELQRKRVENSRVAAELGAAHMAAASATRMALENLAVIEAQIGVLSAAAGNAKLERAKQPAELPIAVWIDVASAFSWQKALLEARR